MPSSRFRELTRRLGKLRKHLLPNKFSLLGVYSDLQIDRARGYRVLAHAEIESYFEDKARLIVNGCLKRWRSNKKPRTVLLNLLSFHLEQKGLSRSDLKNEYGGLTKRIEDSIEKVVTVYNRTLAVNHGVREENILQILLPLGVDRSNIDQTWLNSIDSFGVARGETAHKSFKTHQPLNPEDELKTVDALVKGIEDLDRILEGIKI